MCRKKKTRYKFIFKSFFLFLILLSIFNVFNGIFYSEKSYTNDSIPHLKSADAGLLWYHTAGDSIAAVAISADGNYIVGYCYFRIRKVLKK